MTTERINELESKLTHLTREQQIIAQLVRDLLGRLDFVTLKLAEMKLLLERGLVVRDERMERHPPH